MKPIVIDYIINTLSKSEVWQPSIQVYIDLCIFGNTPSKDFIYRKQNRLFSLLAFFVYLLKATIPLVN